MAIGSLDYFFEAHSRFPIILSYQKVELDIQIISFQIGRSKDCRALEISFIFFEILVIFFYILSSILNLDVSKLKQKLQSDSLEFRKIVNLLAANEMLQKSQYINILASFI